jgi:large subunit ribosomal protein L10
MENPRAEKVAVVDEVREKLEHSSAALLTEYRGLNMAANTTLRRSIREAGGEYKIYKNTLVRFAARDLGIDADQLLTGPTAIAFVEGDVAAVAKALREYGKTNPALVVKGGLLGNRVIDADGVNALADLPPREQLLSQIAGLFAAPAQQFAGLLDALPRSFSYALGALIDKKGGVDSIPAEPEVADATDATEAAAPATETETVEPAEAVAEPAPDTESETTTDAPESTDATPEES